MGLISFIGDALPWVGATIGAVYGTVQFSDTRKTYIKKYPDKSLF